MFTCGNLGNLWLLRGHQSIMQNKPNFLNGKTNATSYATQIYSSIPLRPSPKKQTQTKPILQRNTQYAIRNTQYENQTQTNPIRPIAKMTLNPCPKKHYGKACPLRPCQKQTQSNPILPPFSESPHQPKKTPQNPHPMPTFLSNPTSPQVNLHVICRAQIARVSTFPMIYIS